MEAPGTTGVLRPEAFHGARTRVARLLRIGGPFTAVDVDAKAVAFRGKRDPQVRLSDVSRVRHEAGRFWSRLTITRADGTIFSIGGLPRGMADHLALACEEAALKDLLTDLRDFDGRAYIRTSRVHALLTSRALKQDLLPRAIRAGLLDPGWRWEVYRFARVMEDPEKFRRRVNERYLQSERPRAAESLNAALDANLNESQVNAAITAEDCTLVLAGPGTGKTTTVVAKLAHLRQRRDIPAAEILTLSYNRSTKQELAERIERAGLDADVRTFHAFGLRVVGQGAGKFNVSKMAEDESKFRSAIRGFLHDALVDPETSARVQAVLHSGMLPYRSPFDFKKEGDYYDYVRSVELRTLSDDLVKSFEELEIANFLYSNSIKFRYEEQFPFGPEDRERARYRPDFFLPDHGIYIEHFAVHRDGSTPPFIDGPKYCNGIWWKRAVHAAHRTTLLETYSYQKREGTLLSYLSCQLRKHGVELQPIDPDKLWEQLPPNYTNRLIELLGTFLGHFKSNRFDLSQLRSRAGDHCDAAERERRSVFLDLFEVIYERYQRALAAEEAIDFDDMIVTAGERIDEGSFRSPYRFILVDEFQDISAGRARLLKALADQRDAELFLVGDDWQSIYRFAGSDPQIMSDCESHFGQTAQVALDRSYRLNSSVLSVSTAFVTRNPDQLRKSMRPVKAVQEPRVSIWYGVEDTALHDALLAIGEAWAGRGRASVLVLGRYRLRPEPWDRPRAGARNRLGLKGWDRLRDEFQGLDLQFKTVHSAKGLEADYVVVLGLRNDNYGFPAQVSDDPILDLVLPANERFEHAEERRLFYVALTRAKEHVYVIADPERPSVFVEELRMRNDGDDGPSAGAVSVIGRPPPTPNCPRCGAGVVRERSNRDGRGRFFGCSHYPHCPWLSPVCDGCGSGYIGAKRRCSNEACSATWGACPVCGDGVLMPRSGRYGRYFVCSGRRAIPPCGYRRDARS